MAEAGGGREDQRQQGPQGEREKDLWAGMLSRKPLWVLRPVTWEGTLRPPRALGIPAPGGRLTDPTCSCRATYSGEDSGVRLDISSGVGTVHTGRTEREGVVTTMPSPQALHRGGSYGAPTYCFPGGGLGSLGPLGAVLTSGAETRLGLLWPSASTAVPPGVGCAGWALLGCVHSIPLGVGRRLPLGCAVVLVSPDS